MSLGFDLDDKWGIFHPIFHGLSESYVVKMISTNNVKLVMAIYNMNH